MTERRAYRVGDVSRIARVSIRTLHYYEESGLLTPARTDAGYRLYSSRDLLRLQQILIGRELGLPLETIRQSLDDPAFDHRQALIAQKQQLQQRARQTAAMIAAVDAALALVADTGQEGEMGQLFDGFDSSKYEAEARERWGDTDAYQESARRTKRYTDADWQRLRGEQDAIYRDAAALMHARRPATGDDARAIAERHRLLIDRWFYPCSVKAHLGLASLYDSDPRYAAAMEAFAPGLTVFFIAAIRANAGRTAGRD